jgi:hypothetical protein
VCVGDSGGGLRGGADDTRRRATVSACGTKRGTGARTGDIGGILTTTRNSRGRPRRLGGGGRGRATVAVRLGIGGGGGGSVALGFGRIGAAEGGGGLYRAGVPGQVGPRPRTKALAEQARGRTPSPTRHEVGDD